MLPDTLHNTVLLPEIHSIEFLNKLNLSSFAILAVDQLSSRRFRLTQSFLSLHPTLSEDIFLSSLSQNSFHGKRERVA